VTRWLLTPEAADDLERLDDFLRETAPETSVEIIDLVCSRRFRNFNWRLGTRFFVTTG